jgi:hypothetical protein
VNETSHQTTRVFDGLGTISAEAELAALHLLRASFLPAEPIRQLRDFDPHEVKLIHERIPQYKYSKQPIVTTSVPPMISQKPAPPGSFRPKCLVFTVAPSSLMKLPRRQASTPTTYF